MNDPNLVLEIVWKDSYKEYIICDSWIHEHNCIIVFRRVDGVSEVRGEINTRQTRTVRQMPDKEANEIIKTKRDE